MDRLAAPPGHYMRKVVSALFAYFCVLVPALLAAQTSQNFQTISVDHIHAGMRGVSYTVFQGIQPDRWTWKSWRSAQREWPKGESSWCACMEKKSSTPAWLRA